MQAEKDQRSHIHVSGKASLWSDMREFDEMGPSIGLYFRFLKYLAALFLLMSVIATPAIILCAAGSRVQSQDLDPMKLSLLSIGNVNTNTTNFRKFVLSCAAASKIISYCDVGYTFVFILFIYVWGDTIGNYMARLKDTRIVVSDYAVSIENRVVAVMIGD